MGRLSFLTRDEDEHYEARSVGRLRDMANATRAVGGADPEQTRARLGRLRHGTTGTPQPNRSSA